MPPSPLHISVNILSVLIGSVVSLLESDLVPDHDPEAVHDDALVTDHVKVTESFTCIEVELALSTIVGAGDEPERTLGVMAHSG